MLDYGGFFVPSPHFTSRYHREEHSFGFGVEMRGAETYARREVQPRRQAIKCLETPVLMHSSAFQQRTLQYLLVRGSGLWMDAMFQGSKHLARASTAMRASALSRFERAMHGEGQTERKIGLSGLWQGVLNGISSSAIHLVRTGRCRLLLCLGRRRIVMALESAA